MKLSRIPKQGRVYEEFKLYHLNCEFGTIKELCQDLLEYAKYYTNDELDQIMEIVKQSFDAQAE